MPRWTHKFYAFFMGYFWLPCPICRQAFGGHEIYAGPGLMDTPGSGKCVCRNCGPEAARRNELNYGIRYSQ